MWNDGDDRDEDYEDDADLDRDESSDQCLHCGKPYQRSSLNDPDPCEHFLARWETGYDYGGEEWGGYLDGAPATLESAVREAWATLVSLGRVLLESTGLDPDDELQIETSEVRARLYGLGFVCSVEPPWFGEYTTALAADVARGYVEGGEWVTGFFAERLRDFILDPQSGVALLHNSENRRSSRRSRRLSDRGVAVG